MTDAAVNNGAGRWVEKFEEFLAGRDTEPAFLTKLRRSGMERFADIGFPTTRMEEWRFTNTAPIARQDWRAAVNTEGAEPEAIGTYSYMDCIQITFIDGRFAPEYSQLDGMDGIVVSSLTDALQSHSEIVAANMGTRLDFSDHPFAALNTAFAPDGAFVYIPEGDLPRLPLHLLFYSTGCKGPIASFPRNLIVLGENSQATIMETYAGARESDYLTVPVTEIAVGPYAVLEHYKIQQESLASSHMALQHLWMDRSATATSQNISLGGSFVRNDVLAELAGEGGDCTLNGLYVTKGKQFVDNHMYVQHIAPNCRSYELYKGILDEKSRAVFNGLIHVHRQAQQTDGVQSNRNLLISPDALVNTNPQLLIFADDVRCTHGSTVGQLDRDSLFYLRSRGIGEEAARSLLIYAFASEFVEKIQFEPIRRDLEEFLFTRLPKGEIVRQAV